MSGHTHLAIPPYTVANRKTGQPVIVMESGRSGDYVGKLTLTVDRAGRVNWDSQQAESALIPINDTLAVDPNQPEVKAVEAIVDGYLPPRYDDNDPASAGPKRAICRGSLCR